VGLDFEASDLVWIAIKPERLGDREIPHCVGGEI